jgi:D-alanine-D-alanine ligase
MSREKIAVLMGGASLEREVSLKSGKRVAEALEALGHKVLALDITPELVDTLRCEAPDCCYIALHGKYGEDGTIQELLEFLGIPYTGSGVIASTLAWDKSVAKYLLRGADIPTPAWITLTADAFKEMGEKLKARGRSYYLLSYCSRISIVCYNYRNLKLFF